MELPGAGQGRNLYMFLLTVTLVIGLFLGALLVSNLTTPADQVQQPENVPDISSSIGEAGSDLPISQETLRKLLEYLPNDFLLSMLNRSQIMDSQPLDLGDETSIGSNPLSSGNNSRISSGSLYTEPDDTVHFTVESEEPAYWRLTAYDQYMFDGWERTAGDPDMTIPREDQRQVLTQNITFNSRMDGVPGAWRLTETSVPDEELSRDPEHGWQRQQASEPGETAQVTSVLPVEDRERLQNAGDKYPDRIEQRYTKLPEGIPERVHARTDSVTDSASTPYETARVVEAWLRENYDYSLDIPEGSGKIVDDLLFERDKAYCSHFASAMTVMLRSEGVPARYVTGYNSGTYNESIDAYQVKGMHAHAWVEVYFPDAGWVPFEPTPASSRADAINNATGSDDAAADDYNMSQSNGDSPDPGNQTEDEQQEEEQEPFAITSIQTNVSGQTARSGAPVDIDVTTSVGQTERVVLLDRFGNELAMDWDEGVYTTQVTPAGIGCDTGDRVPCPLVVEATNGTATVTANTTVYVDDIPPSIGTVSLNTTKPIQNRSLGVAVSIPDESNRTIESVRAGHQDTIGRELSWNGTVWTGAVPVRENGTITVDVADFAGNRDTATSERYEAQAPPGPPWYTRPLGQLVIAIILVLIGCVFAWYRGWLDKERITTALRWLIGVLRMTPDILVRVIVGGTRAALRFMLRAVALIRTTITDPREVLAMIRARIQRYLDSVSYGITQVQEKGAVAAVKEQAGLSRKQFETPFEETWNRLCDASPLTPVTHYTPAEIGASVREARDIPPEVVDTLVKTFHQKNYSSHAIDIDRQTLERISKQLEDEDGSGT